MNPRNRVLSTIILFTAICLSQQTDAGTVPNSTIDRLLPALARVESKGDAKAVGDGGAAIGIYQIHRCYWQDAVEFDKNLGGRYEDCFNPDYARRVVCAYLRRYAPNHATLEQLARVHNGGPNGHHKSATVKYWNKIKKEMTK
jgi:soluble lytic murein transglycosylase-like protein